MDLFEKCFDFKRADEVKAMGVYPYFRAIQANEGPVVQIEGKKDGNLEVKKYEIINEFEVSDYLPTVKRPIADILSDIESLTDEFIISKEGFLFRKLKLCLQIKQTVFL